ncbi:AtpZ/AtpI family protein [Paludicola sp. MB14-C6]|uniref:AtpZ/AtpI family protein n=1 Tax=Paludihabitans sp. MB14-C6 TaxID=3070656 RepID=UPI0027DD5D4A|nr:AtpZ/AtpI family protein [Paludicola sp. MB14-C6]WMJ21829.1 AtpZ/AtpI family protein [Paludicola sp. MB14-C6]
MKNNTEWISIAKGIAAISQFGLSIIMPIVLCTFLGVYLKNKFAIPDYIVILLVLLGVLSGISSAVSFIKSFMKQEQKKDQLKQMTPKSNHTSERR